MKPIRAINAYQLIKAVSKLGYETSRQTGSHVRLTTFQNGQHHITIPNHDPLKTGTINAILNDIAQHFSISKQELIEQIFKQ
jgi:predicted RNA binding protein YcfA (HicA-like mRNA interferase family)